MGQSLAYHIHDTYPDSDTQTTTDGTRRHTLIAPPCVPGSFTGIMWDVRAHDLPFEYIEISSVWLRGNLGPISVWYVHSPFVSLLWASCSPGPGFHSVHARQAGQQQTASAASTRIPASGQSTMTACTVNHDALHVCARASTL